MKHVVTLAIALIACTAHAQKQVYKCETRGKTEYSHSPCVGAVEIDTTPTRGMDKMSGQSRKSLQLQMLETREAFAEGTKPLHGMSKEQFLKRSDRFRLPPNDRVACSQLDQSLPALRSAAERAAANDKATADLRLYQARKRFNDLNC